MRRRVMLALCLLLLFQPGRVPAHAQASRPKLVVMIVVDQLRGDYPSRYGALLEKGFRRLTTQGAWFRKAAYPYLNTLTCAGHATVATGAFPYKHGMMQNVWYDRESEKPVTCTNDAKVSDISVAGTAGGPGDSAARLMLPTLAEVMHRDLKARVVTMSIKARSAIMLAGHAGDAILWLNDRGQLQTSTAYAQAVPTWVETFGKTNPAEGDLGRTWVRSLPVERYQYADDVPSEKPGGGWSASFPHPLGTAADPAYFSRWEVSPYADEYLEALAERAIDTLHLGGDDHPDFLGISFSTLDLAGHAFGPRSHEVQDVLVRLDATLSKLLAYLDEKVGAANYVLALSADHGVADVPEQIEGAGRIQSPTVSATIEGALKSSPGYGDGPFVAASAAGDIYLKPGVFARLQKDANTMDAVKHAIAAIPGVARVLTADQLETSTARTSKDAQVRAAALSYVPGRSGDFIIIPKENWIFGATTTTHGTLYPYDQQVPVIFFGAGIRPGVFDGAATPADIAPTLAALEGVQIGAAEGRVLTTALRNPPRTTQAGR